MSWRRFLVLLRGLGPGSALAISMTDDDKNVAQKDRKPDEFENDEDAENWLLSQLGVKKVGE